MRYGYNNIPAHYDYLNAITGQINPSSVHVKNTELEWFFEKYLIQKLFSIHKITLPKEWNKDLFPYLLYLIGYMAVVNTDKWGVIYQPCMPYGRGIYYQPVRVKVVNPLLKGSINPIIDKECTVIKLAPNWSGAYDLVSYYASMMALTCESAGINILNSRLAYVFMADGKANAESFKKMYDKLSNEPMVVTDKKLYNQDGSPNWLQFNTNLQQSYIADKLLIDLNKWEDEFNTQVGIPNANTDKKERLITGEVENNNADTSALAQLWYESIKDGFEKTNNMFGLDLKIELNYDYKGGEKQDDRNIINSRTL